MEGVYWLCAVLFSLMVTVVDFVLTDCEYMVSVPESRTVSIDFETELICEMNIEPDKFQWKFYPSDRPQNPAASINLSNSTWHLIPEGKYTNQRKKSSLLLQVNNTNFAGDYQCLAYYGAYVVASVPWRISIADLKPFPYQKNAEITTTIGNTVSWRCKPPESNPEAYVDYHRDGHYIEPLFLQPQINSLILPNVSQQDSGTYTCSATNTIIPPLSSDTVLKLSVVKYGPQRAPYFVIEPKKVYTVVKGSTVFLECSAIGNPVPKVVWFKKNSQLPSDRIEMVPGGLKIRNVTSKDDGLYVCNHTNVHGTASHLITLIYDEEPSVECLMNNTDVKQGDNLDLDCVVRGTPEPQVSWFLNGFSVNNDSAVEAIGNKIYFRPIEKRHAGNLQLFARNRVNTVYSSISIRVIPLSTSIDDVSANPSHGHHQRPHRKSNKTKRPNKHGKSPPMIPPNKPVVARLSDESVAVRWNVPNNNGLPIQFFKIQYKEVGPANDHHGRRKGSGWETPNGEIPPNIKAYDVTNLKPDHVYKFRIAAVYSNNDFKLSAVSNRFHLRRLDFDNKVPLPVPNITRTESVSSTSVRIYWECPRVPNVQLEGFYINYMSASTAGDYMKATAEGANTTSYLITHLQPQTIYDVKVASFNSKFASEFSAIVKEKTGVLPVEMTTLMTPPTMAPKSEASGGFGNLYFVIAGVIIGLAVLISGVLLVLFVCRKWQKKKTADQIHDKQAVDEHHIQADGNDYLVGTKSVPRTNGCVLPGNRITITSNPMADADNKNQTMMIEMRNFPTTQNNNVRHESSPPTPSASQESHPPTDSIKEKNKLKKNNKKIKVDGNAPASGENYV